MSGFNLKRAGIVASLVLATVSLSACWTDPVGPNTCIGTVNGDDAAGVQLWLSGYAQPVSWERGWWYDGWGNPIGWSVTEDSDICVVLDQRFSPDTTNVVVWVDQPPVPQHLEHTEGTVSE